MNKILIALAFIIIGCNNSVHKSDRDPNNIFNIDVTYGKKPSPKRVDTKFSFNNLEEIDSFYTGRNNEGKISARFQAIKFLHDYKGSGYKVCPDENEDNLLSEGNINPVAKDFIKDSFFEKK